MSIVLTLYSRAGCHLCAEMALQLKSLDQTINFDLEIIDIDTDPDLEARYATRIPVLVADGKIISQYKRDDDAVVDFLTQASVSRL